MLIAKEPFAFLRIMDRASHTPRQWHLQVVRRPARDTGSGSSIAWGMQYCFPPAVTNVEARGG
jgi:hypothetical protein